MSSVYDWSIVAANNGAADAAMTWAEGMAPASVNNSARQLVARVAELLGDIDGSLTAGGTSSALTVTANSAFTTYANGRIIAVKASVDNAASATLNVNGIGAKSIRKFTPTEAALAGGEMKNAGIYLLMYNTALNSAAGGWHLLSPSLIEVVAATTAVAGIVELATDAEAIARSDTARAVTPANLAAAIGPASSTDNAIARFDSTAGKLQNSGVTIDDSNVITSISSAAGTLLALQSTDAGAGSGPNLDLHRNSASPAASDIISQIVFYGQDSGGAKTAYAEITGQIADPTNGSEDGTVYIATNVGGVYAVRLDITGGNTNVTGNFSTSGQAIFSVSAAEIFRTTSTAIHIGKTSGNLTNAGTSFFATGASDGLFQCTRDSDIVGQFNVINPVGTETVLEFMTSGTAKGSITINGSTTAYNTSSDRRLKENRRDFDAGAILDKIKVWEFDWKEDGSVGHGVIAQEAIKAYPQAISRPQKRRQKWQADYSKYVPLLIREIQNLREEIRAMKA